MTFIFHATLNTCRDKQLNENINKVPFFCAVWNKIYGRNLRDDNIHVEINIYIRDFFLNCLKKFKL